jgi:hypothetical protein
LAPLQPRQPVPAQKAAKPARTANTVNTVTKMEVVAVCVNNISITNDYMVLITYDLQSDHVRVKTALKAKGWKDRITASNGIVCILPNTSLWKEGIDAASARDEVREVVKAPTLERLFAVVFDSWAAIKGLDF